MTALMAMLGLLPAHCRTAWAQRRPGPFAVVIIGGLIADTLLTIFLVPLLYPYFEEKAAKG